MGFSTSALKRRGAPYPLVRHGGGASGLRDDERRAQLSDQYFDRGGFASLSRSQGGIVALRHLLAEIDAANADHHSARLIKAFGTLGGVFAATPEAIDAVAGAAVSSLLNTARAAVETSLREKVLRNTCDVEMPAFREYVRSRLQNLKDEALLVVFLDSEKGFIADEIVSQGGVIGLDISGRTLFRRALELNATALILAHNHPSGKAIPSRTDIAATRRLHLTAATLNITLLDHLVVGNGQIASMRLGGRL
jgi:DNA repair protein RadC